MSFSNLIQKERTIKVGEWLQILLSICGPRNSGVWLKWRYELCPGGEILCKVSGRHLDIIDRYNFLKTAKFLAEVQAVRMVKEVLKSLPELSEEFKPEEYLRVEFYHERENDTALVATWEKKKFVFIGGAT